MHPLLTKQFEAQAAFQSADHAWTIELARVFGKRMFDARYTAKGRGEPGTTLRTLYLAREKAMWAWHAACDAYRERA